MIPPQCRTPRWVRGLKYQDSYDQTFKEAVAPHDGCVDWNKIWWYTVNQHRTSHPTMGAWIEISVNWMMYWLERVAPHDGCVDWNLSGDVWWLQKWEGRTPRWVRGLKFANGWTKQSASGVAPHDGCVDWNSKVKKNGGIQKWSHPTMGAWIEIIWTVRLDMRKRSRTPRWVRGLKLTCW